MFLFYCIAKRCKECWVTSRVCGIWRLPKNHVQILSNPLCVRFQTNNKFISQSNNSIIQTLTRHYQQDELGKLKVFFMVGRAKKAQNSRETCFAKFRRCTIFCSEKFKSVFWLYARAAEDSSSCDHENSVIDWHKQQKNRPTREKNVCVIDAVKDYSRL